MHRPKPTMKWSQKSEGENVFDGLSNGVTNKKTNFEMATSQTQIQSNQMEFCLWCSKQWKSQISHFNTPDVSKSGYLHLKLSAYHKYFLWFGWGGPFKRFLKLVFSWNRKPHNKKSVNVQIFMYRCWTYMAFLDFRICGMCLRRLSSHLLDTCISKCPRIPSKLLVLWIMNCQCIGVNP